MGFGILNPIVGGSLEAYGALTGNKTATNAGHAITNPDVHLASLSNLGFGGQSGFAYGAPATTASDNQGVVKGDSTTAPALIVGSTVGSDGLTAAQRAANNQAIDLANYQLGLLPQQLQAAQNNIQHTYNQNLNELTSGRNAAQQNYDQSTAQNQQQYVTNKDQIDQQASNGLRGLLRILGQHGAGGSSAALYAAPDAVGQVAQQQRSGAGQTYGQNQQALDTNFNTYLSGFDNSKKQLADWLTQQQNAARSSNEQNRQTILQQLAGLQTNAANAQPFIDQIKTSAQNVANLANFNPTYTGVTPTYTAPDVASYTVNQAGAPALGTPSNNTGAGTSFLTYLLGLNKDKQSPVLG